MRKAVRIGIAMAVIAGLGITTVSPIISYADNTNQEHQDGSIPVKSWEKLTLNIDGKQKYTYEPLDSNFTRTCLSINEPKEITANYEPQGDKTSTLYSGIDKLNVEDSKDITMAVDGRTIKGKQYISTVFRQPVTINWFNIGDFFSTTKVTFNGIEADFNPYGDGKDSYNDVGKYNYSTGTAIIHTTMSDNEFEEFMKGTMKNGGTEITGLPTGWTANTTEDGANIGPGIHHNLDTKETTEIYSYSNPDYPQVKYNIAVTITNTPPQQEQTTNDTPAQTTSDAQTQASQSSPELVQTGIEQTAAAITAIAATAGTAHIIAKRRRNR